MAELMRRRRRPLYDSGTGRVPCDGDREKNFWACDVSAIATFVRRSPKIRQSGSSETCWSSGDMIWSRVPKRAGLVIRDPVPASYVSWVDAADTELLCRVLWSIPHSV